MTLFILLIVAIVLFCVAAALAFVACHVEDSAGSFAVGWLVLLTTFILIGIAIKLRPLELAELEREIRRIDERPACPCVQVKPETEQPKEL